jgi:Zn-dependent protease with chaperone function
LTVRLTLLSFAAAMLIGCAQVPSRDLQPGESPDLATTEAGLWMHMDKLENRLKASGRIVEDDALDAYLRDIVCRLEPAHCPNIRIYVVDVPYFNASMAPNGMMQVWTGLLVRAENEAQLAFVLGHELAHYVRRHSLQRWIDLQNKANAASIFSVLSSAAGVGYVGYMAEIAALTSVLSFSRDQEREADEVGTARVVEAGYDPQEAVRIWQALKKEKSVSEKKESLAFLSTHPGIDERIENLKSASMNITTDADQWIVGREQLNKVRTGHQDEWLSDELTRGEYAESEVLFHRLLETSEQRGLLNFYLGELYRKRSDDGDSERAIEAYQLALREPDAPARVYRSLGQSLIRVDRDTEARAALGKYLEAAPDAPDRQIIEYQIESLR